MYIYVGQSIDSGDAYKIYAMSDINLVETIIHSKDFNCIPENSCFIESEIYYSKYHGVPFRYQYASLQVNLLQLSFNDKLRVMYVIDQSEMAHSIIGFAPNSTFFSYFVFQNYIRDLRISFYFDWENVVYFRSDVYDSAKLPLNTTLNANVKFYKQSKKEPEMLKFCLANQASLIYPDAVYFSVRKELFPDWKAFLLKTKSESNMNEVGSIKYNITFWLNSENIPNLGFMDFMIDDLVDDRNTLKIETFDERYDEGRGCDVYIGQLTLRKFNYKFYYSEDENGKYTFQFIYDGLIGILSDSEHASSLLWLQMVFFVIVFSFISFIAYEYILKKNEDLGMRDEDLSIPGEENEERDYFETNFKITKEEIALLEAKLN